MYIIKKSFDKKYLVREEDENFVTLNLVHDRSAATKFNSMTEASTIKNEIVNNAKEQIENTTDRIELESLQDFVALTVIQE